MKLSFAILFAFACLAFTASSQYVTLTQAQIDANLEFLIDIRNFGVGYVVQKGVYETTGAKFPGLNYNLTKQERVERRSTTAAAYYRFTVLLAEQENQAIVRATFTIRYDHRNNAFLVSSWRYTVLRTGNKSGGYNAFIPIDVRPFNAEILEEMPQFNERVEEVVASLIQGEILPDTSYDWSFVYFGLQKTGTELKTFSVKLVDDNGVYYRIEFDYSTDPETVADYQRALINPQWRRV